MVVRAALLIAGWCLLQGVAIAQAGEAEPEKDGEFLQCRIAVWEMPAVKLSDAKWIDDPDVYLSAITAEAKSELKHVHYGFSVLNLEQHEQTIELFRRHGATRTVTTPAAVVRVGQSVHINYGKDNLESGRVIPAVVERDANGEEIDKVLSTECLRITSRLDEDGGIHLETTFWLEEKRNVDGARVLNKTMLGTSCRLGNDCRIWLSQQTTEGMLDAVARLTTPPQRLIVVEVVRVKDGVTGDE